MAGVAGLETNGCQDQKPDALPTWTIPPKNFVTIYF